MALFKVICSFLFITVICTSCNENDNSSKHISSVARNYLRYKMGNSSSNNVYSLSNAGMPSATSWQPMSGGRHDGESKRDTTTSVPGMNCGTMTMVTNPDSSITTTIDYGEGCLTTYDGYSNFSFGKYSSTYGNRDDREGSVRRSEYFGNVIMQNYGAIYETPDGKYEWKSTGSSSYSGSSEYDERTNQYTGYYEHSGSDVNVRDGVAYSYSGEGKGFYDNEKSVVQKNDYHYGSEDNSYSTTVLEPLVSRMDCYSALANEGYSSSSASLASCFWIPIYVSGVERVTYKQGEEEGSFIIDYGDGSCDRVITIYENESRVEVDLNDEQLMQ